MAFKLPDEEIVTQPQEQPQVEETTDESSTIETEVAPEEIVVTIGEETEPEEHEDSTHGTPVWVKAVRKQNRELQKQVRELKAQIVAPVAAAEVPPVGEKPSLVGCDYDTVKYEADLAAWYERKRLADEKLAKVKAQAAQQEQRWAQRQVEYKTAKDQLNAEDYDDAEIIVQDLFDVTQQGIIVHGAKNAAQVVYALGKNPSKAKELADIKDPIEFAFAVARLESQLKFNVNARRPSVQPESRVVGSGKPAGISDATLERLRAEASKTGDYTKVSAYRKQLRDNQRR